MPENPPQDALESPGMIGEPPSARDRAIPADRAEHAIRSAREWDDVAGSYAQRRLAALGIDEDRRGAIDSSRDSNRQACERYPNRRAFETAPCAERSRTWWMVKGACG
jgi:hypothetical protein